MNGTTRIDGVTTRFHVYTTKEGRYKKKELKLVEIVSSTKVMVNKHISVS